MPEDTVIAGISCSKVLSHLSEFVDGALPQAQARALQGHLAECEHCARFGSEFAEALGQLKEQLRCDEPLTHDIANRLEARLDACESE